MMNRNAAAVIFKRYDPSVSGSMTQQNFRFAQREFATAGLVTCDLEKCLAELDPNGKGEIPFNDFMTWLEETKGAGYSSSKTSPARNSSGTISRLFGSLMGSKKQEEETSPIIAQVQTTITPTPTTRKSLTVAKDEPVNDNDFQNMFRKKPSVVISEDEMMEDKREDDKYIRVCVKKPLGLTLGENESDGAMGVHVESFSKDGNAAATGLIRPGLLLIEACGVNVQRSDFDSIMDILREAPADKPLSLVFADPANVLPPEEPTPSSPSASAVNNVDSSPAVEVPSSVIEADVARNDAPIASISSSPSSTGAVRKEAPKPARVGSFTSRKAAALKAASSRRMETNNSPAVVVATENDSDVSETESEESKDSRPKATSTPALFGVPAHLQGVAGFDVDDEESDGEVSGSTWSTREGKFSESGSVPSVVKPLHQQKPQENQATQAQTKQKTQSQDDAPNQVKDAPEQRKQQTSVPKESLSEAQHLPPNQENAAKDGTSVAQSGRSSRSLFRGNSLKHMKNKLQKQNSGDDASPKKDGGVSLVLSRPTMPKRAPTTKPHAKARHVESEARSQASDERASTSKPAELQEEQPPLHAGVKKPRGGIARINKSEPTTLRSEMNTTKPSQLDVSTTAPSPIVAAARKPTSVASLSGAARELSDDTSHRTASDADSAEMEKQSRRNNMDYLLSEGISQMKKDIRALSLKTEKPADATPISEPKPRIAQPQKFRDAPCVSTDHTKQSNYSAPPIPDVDSITSNPFFSSLRSEPVGVADAASISESGSAFEQRKSYTSEASIERSIQPPSVSNYLRNEDTERWTQTDYTNVLEDEYLNPYQLLLSEKSEIAHAREQQRIEYEEALEHIADELTRSNALLDEREAQLASAIEAHEIQLQQRALALQEAVEEEKRQLDSRWEALRKAERESSTLHAQRVSELLNLAHVLVLHHDKLHTDKKKIARQRYHLDLAMQDMHRFNTFQPNSTHIAGPVRWKTESNRHTDTYFVSPSKTRGSPGSPYSPVTYTTSPAAKRWISPGPSTRFSKTAN